MKRFVVLFLTLALLAAACSGGSNEPELVGIRASTDTAVGDSRFLFAVAELDGTRRGGPDEEISVTAKALESPDTSIEAEADFLWVVEGAFGLYRVDLPFETPGVWEIDFTISTGEATQPFLVDVAASPATVAIGEPAPAVATPTTADLPLDDLTTDPDPMSELYSKSLEDALDDGRKTVVIFATPAFCTSAACGPMLDQTKAVAATRPDADFVHVEVYEGFNEPGFAPDVDHLVDAVVAFGLPSEPWVFVMDEKGIVTSRLEGVLGDGELEAVLDG